MAHQFKKQFGQNFLRNSRFAKALLEAAQIEAGDTVIEIGPGDGRVTRELLERGCKVIAIEVDYDLVVSLIKEFNHSPGFEIIHQDVLTVSIPDLNAKYGLEKGYKVIGSLPYNISKQIIAKFIDCDPLPTCMAFIVQEEVAQTYVAAAPKASFLSNWTRLRAEVKKGLSIPNTQFFPVPKVNGAILIIKPLNQAERGEFTKLDRLLRIGFSSPRKTLRNNLNAISTLPREKLDKVLQELKIEKQRAGELTVAGWKELNKTLDF
jgi:16S rRNA (adenine1518-N6/adenine1519-N6)-dimethyltransferase